MREAPAGVFAQMTGRVIGCASDRLELIMDSQRDLTSVSNSPFTDYCIGTDLPPKNPNQSID